MKYFILASHASAYGNGTGGDSEPVWCGFRSSTRAGGARPKAFECTRKSHFLHVDNELFMFML